MSRMAARTDGAFSSEVARALELLGEGVGSRAADALLDPGGAARLVRGLSAGSSLLLRAAPELREEAKGYAALPVDPAWARIARGSAEVAVAPLRVSGDATKARRAEVKAVAVRAREEPCCDSASCKLTRTAASVWLEVGDVGGAGDGGASRWLVAEARDLE